MRKPDQKYYGKLMLFGEHTVNIGSPALLIPFRRFEARWMQGSHHTNPSHQTLYQYIEFLAQHQSQFPWLHIPLMKSFVEKGWYFHSHIPQNYGIGSSGALVAAIYEQFSVQQSISLQETRQQLGMMESYFHGNSSGLDPLCCLYQKPLLVQADKQIRFLDIPEAQFLQSLWLLDSGQPSSTSSMVAYFNRQMLSYRFYTQLNTVLLPAVDQAIKAAIQGDGKQVEIPLSRISSFQLEYLPQMIPEPLHALWKQGIESGAYVLKLCGSGGGGFFLLHAAQSVSLPDLPKGMRLLSLV